MEQTQVLIAGAGPPGLMMACQLAMRNIHFRIFDKSDKPHSGSGALVIHARSLEILNDMGIAGRAISNGVLAGKINVVFNGKKPLTLAIKKMGTGLTEFPGLLLLEQSKTEQLLAEFLMTYGCSVERKCELTGFTQHDEGCTSIVRNHNGKSIIIESKYLIAADGSHSFIRDQLKIPFSGKTYSLSLFVFDGKAEFDFPRDEICFCFTGESSAGIFPLNKGRWRVDGTIPRSTAAREKIDFKDIEPGFASRNQLKIRLYEPEMFSVFHSHQQYAGAFKYKRCFMIGDAAHVFSPVGAQGMNTGMQDALNLAWKLSMVLEGYAKETLLNSYQQERQPLAKKMIKSTDHFYRLVTSDSKQDQKIRLRIAPFLIKILFPVLERQRILARYFFNGISEIGINYRNSPLSMRDSWFRTGLRSPCPGDRLPYFRFNLDGSEVNIQDLAGGPLFNLLIFSANSIPPDFITRLSQHSRWLKIQYIPRDPGTIPLYKRLGIGKTGCYLVRPDMYVAYISKQLDIHPLQKYLLRLSVIPRPEPGQY
jgi:2-polyprenyl-6-methoxyphenol hydroxylase-like FAD-dependent oxidoreductase